jgi:hypothetical protein
MYAHVYLTICYNAILVAIAVYKRVYLCLHYRSSWSVCSSQSLLHKSTATPMYALFSMQVTLVRLREHCLNNLCIELIKAYKELLITAAQCMTSRKQAAEFMLTVNTLLNKVRT